VKPKFIIIDPSLCDLQGHHYECSVSVATAAQKRGYEAIIITNKNFSTYLYPQNIKIIPEFEVDWFNNSTKKLTLTQQKIKNITDSLLGFNLQQIILDYQHKLNYQIFKLKLTKPKAKLFLEKVEGSTSRLITWMKKDVNLIQYIPFANTLWGLLKIIWGLIRFFLNLIFKNLRKIWLKFFTIKNLTFSESINKIIQQLQPTAQDHIFIHTLGIEQLEALFPILINSDTSNLPQYHLMLRRDIDDPLVKNAPGIGIYACLNQFYQSQLFPKKVRFYTDTLPLIERYNSLSPIKFLEIPVPFRQEKLIANINQKKDRKENELIHLVYLGDARSEKGYLHLPQIVEDLWQDYLANKKVRMTIQSNLSIEGGEAGILAARLKLEQYADNQVTVIKETMDTEEYYQLLASADLVIIPYELNSYKYRTSGVLTESLAAGKPVIVPAHSWLATQVDETRAGIYQQPKDISKTIIQVINNLDYYQKNAQAFSLKWREKHSADNLINCLLSEPKFEEVSISFSQKNNQIVSDNQVLLVINGDSLLNYREEAQVCLSYLQYFFQLEFQISIVFYFLDNNYYNQVPDELIQRLKSLISSYNITKSYCLTQVDECPQFLDDLSQDQYLEEVYKNQASFTRSLVYINSLLIPDSLINYLKGQTLDLIVIDSIISKILVNNLGLQNIPLICQVTDFQSYKYALINQHDINQQEWQKEQNLFSEVNLILTINPVHMDKLKTINPHLVVYSLPNSYQLEAFPALMNDSLRLLIKKPITPHYPHQQKHKIAVLYPWEDILERKAGASQRVGLLLDYLAKENNYIWVFTVGAEKECLINQIRYNFYEQNFNEFELVKQVYSSSYSALINSNQLTQSESKINQLTNAQELAKVKEDWRLSMYYQFRFDPNFQAWIKKIVDWADVVILEYPFWAKNVAEICQAKGVKLVLTAHDLIYQQVPKNSPIRQILLAEEISSLQRADQVITVSEDDQKLLKNYQIDSVVIPNPVKFNSLELDNLDEIKANYLKTYSWLEENYCLFVGSGHFPNLEAVQNIKQIAQDYQKISQKIDCKFVVVGSCCSPENFGNFIALGKVEFELLNLIYQQAKLILAPMSSGTGSSLKVMEAMSYGKVILGTKIAFRGYPIKVDQEVIIADNFLDYPSIIQQLLSNQQQLLAMGKQAQQLAKNYDYRQLYQSYLDIINLSNRQDVIS
jgi:glycosyltransferase involved in cell wall biosynthesis